MTHRPNPIEAAIIVLGLILAVATYAVQAEPITVEVTTTTTADVTDLVESLQIQIDALKAENAAIRALLEPKDDEGGTEAPTPDPPDEANPFAVTTTPVLSQDEAVRTPIDHGQEITVSPNAPYTLSVFANDGGITTQLYTGEDDWTFVLPKVGVHTIIVKPDAGDTVRFYADHAAALGEGPSLPPVGGDLPVVEVRGSSYGEEMEFGHPQDLVVSGKRYQGIDSHVKDKGVGVLIRGKQGGTVTIRDVEAFDLSAGIVVQGDKDNPIERLSFKDVRIGWTWKDYIDTSNFWTDRPQGLFTANAKAIDAEGLEIIQSYRPGDTLLFDRQHNWYVSGSGQQLQQFQLNLKNSVLIGGMFSGINASQLHSADRVYIIGSAVNWNIDGRIDSGSVTAITGKVTNSYSIDPHNIPIFGRAATGEIITRPWGQHFIYRESPIAGVTVLNGVGLDMDKLLAAPRGQMYLEVERQLREKGLME